MQRRRLGRSEIEVSAISLGTMTFGSKNSEAEGHAQMDLALDRGVDFLDTAEMYAVPVSAEHYGRTEEIIGSWLAARKNRDKVVLATKVVGPGSFPYIRDGKPRLDRKNIEAALEASLKRLRSDYVDLYQLHWPDRPMHAFGKLGYEYDPAKDYGEVVPLEETLGVLDDLLKAGKVRTVGVSNETPWGVMRLIALAEAGKGPRMVSIQNPYSLLNRSFETRLAEVALREDCGLLAYAPVAAGMLTGKYLGGAKPAGARFTLNPENRRYRTEQGEKATEAYVALARERGLDPARMAIAFVLSRDFTTSAIIGATSLEQLENNLGAADLALDEETLKALDSIHSTYTYPCP